MPIYEYQCTSCGHHLEVLQKITEEPLTVCPKCNAPLNKLVSAAGLQFKGSGWYLTDYSHKGKAKQGGAAADEKNTETASASQEGPTKTQSTKEASTTQPAKEQSKETVSQASSSNRSGE